MALPAGFVIDKPEKVKLPSGFVLDSDKTGLPSIVKSEPREAPTYDPLGQVIGDVPEPLDYTVEGQGQMNKPGAFTAIADLAKQFIAPGVKAPFALPQATETAVKGFARQAMEGTPEAIMPSSVFQPGLDTEETLFGPETDVQKARRKLQAQRAVAAMPSIPGAAALNKIGENVQKDILGSLSPEAKTALKESQITGNIFKGEVDFGTNPNAYGYALQAANVFGSMAPVIATAMVTKSPGAGGFVGGTMAADEAATSAAEFINKIPDAELRQKSPLYAELIAGGATPKEARALTIKKAAESGAALQGLVATFGDVLTGKLVTGAFDKTIAKLGTNRLARAGGVGAASSLEEALQETGEGLSSDVALKNVIPSKELGEDSAANFILGVLGGAGPGVFKGALSEGEAKEPKREKYVQPEGGLAELIARQKGFLRPEGGPPTAPVAPAPPAPPAPPAAPVVAPPSDAMDTQAMLAELIDSINPPPKEAPTIPAGIVKPTPSLQKPETEKPTFDATGWTKSEKTINKKTGELNIPEGVERYTKEDEDGTSRRVLTRNGEVTQSETTTPTIELTNSVFGDEGETISGRIKANDLNGTLYFFRDDNGQIIKMSPRASQQYKEGVPANKIAELEFSDAGGIRPDGTKTPHTTTSVLAGAKPKPAAVEAPVEQPPSTELIKQVLPEPAVKERPSTAEIFNGIIDGWQGSADKLPEQTRNWLTENGLIQGKNTTPMGQRLMDTIKQAEEQHRITEGLKGVEAMKRGERMPPAVSMTTEQMDQVVDAFIAANKPKGKPVETPKPVVKPTPVVKAAPVEEVRPADAEGVLPDEAFGITGGEAPKPQEFVEAKQAIDQVTKQVTKMRAKPAGSLWSRLTGTLNPEELREIFGKKPNLGQRRLGVVQGEGDGAYIVDMVDDGLLDGFLPPNMRHDSNTFDATTSAQYIKDAIGNRDYLPFDAKAEIEMMFGSVESAERLVKEYLTEEEQNRELQIAADEQREADQEAEVIEPIDKNRPAAADKTEALELTAPTEDELTAKQDEIDRLTKENERLAKQAEDKAKADEQAAEFTLTGSDRAADVAAARGQKDIFAEAPAEEAPVDNKQEIADLREEQKVLIRQIIKAGLQETPEQEARMGEIDRRLRELEGKAPVKPVEKQEVKQRSVEEIREELEDLQDRASEEFNKDKKKKLASDVYKLQGELAIAEGRAAKVASEEKPAAPTEAEIEAAEEAAEEAIRNKAEAEIDEGPIGQAIAKIENGDIETKAQIRTFIKKLERDGVLDDVEDVREGLSDREQDASEVLDTLSGLLDEARDNAIEERVDELLEERETEQPEAPEGTVATPDGAVLRYPLAVSMVGEGYKVLALDDPRTYKDKGGEPHRTFEKGPLRIAMTSQRTLFQNRNSVNTGFGNPDDVTLESIMVDPGKRNQGLATQAMNDVIEAADKNGITLYLEPVPIVNIKQNDFGLDRDQLVDFYSKFGFEFQEDSNKVMQRKPGAEVEVLPAEEPQIAGQVGFEPYTIEGDFTEVAEEQQRLMLEDQTENLSDDQVSTLEKHYGAKIDSDEFFTKLREDVSNFIIKGATAVNGKIRAIIRQLANGVLAVGIAFNPQYMSQPLNVMMPTDNVRTEEVLAKVPDAATDKMSEPAKRAFAVIYPALQEQMMAKDKLFIMADKPSGRVFVFNPDGSLLLEKKSLFGLAKGDIYVGDNDKPQNRITPAGLFDLKFVDAQKGAAEKRTAGDYDTGTVLAINDPDGTITIMHSVWLKEKDAAQRAAALRNESPADSRYSFGCINVDAPTYKYMVDNHAKQMDGAALFIVPEAGVDVMSFITGKGAMSEDLARIKIKPVTKEVRTPQRQATQAEAKTKTPGREQRFFSIENPNVVEVNGRSIPVTKNRLEKNNQIVKVNVNAFDDAFSNTEWQYIGTGGKGGIKDRYKNFGEFIKNAKSIEAPNVAVNKDGAIVFGDGRHRYAYLRDAGITNIPLSMDAESIRNAQKFGYISEPINKSLEDGLVNMVNSMADNMAEDEKKRSPSLKRTLKTYNRQRKAGKMSDEMYVMMSDSAILEDEERRLAAEGKPRKRGYLHIQNRLNEAVQAGDISREAYDLANWFMLQNEALVDDLGISIKANKREGTGGFYNNLARIFTLIKKSSSDLTTVHEILHHLERMMPLKIQQAIRKAWLTQLTKAAKATKDPVQKLYFEAVLDANFGDNKHAMVNIPEGAGVAYSNARMALEDMARGNTSVKLAEMLLLQGAVPLDMYQFFNPSEFWAVNGSRIVEGRFEAVKGGTLSKLKNWLRELGQTIKSIFGLKSDASIIRALDSLAKSDGKFVTDEMLGVGDYQSIERRNYEGGEAPEPDMEIPEMSFMDDTIYKFGDKLIDTKRLIESIKSTGKKLNEQFDAYMKEENYHGRLAKRTSDFLDDEMRPVLQEMQDKNVSLDELETFLLNRHAKEANAYIAKINPTGFPEAGSSVSDADADKYMAALTPEKRKDLTALAAKVDKIVKETQRVLVANGLETQDTIDEWNKTYKHYVPLQRDNLDFVHTGRGVMGGFATRGSASKRRVGSDKPVIDIFANIAMQRERALRRSEQARVGRALYGMAIKHPNPGFWLAINPDAIKDKDKLEAELISLGLKPEDAQNIIQEPRQPMFDKKTGQVKYQVNPLLRNSPNVFPVRINGEDRFIFFNPNDPRALRMVEAIKNLDTERLGDVIGAVGMVTRWFASVNTQYNIVFGGVNFLRDLGAASLNLSTTEIAGKEKEVRANVLPALRAIYRDLRGKGATTEAMAEMQDWFERFQLAGGQTGYQNQFAETKRKGNVVEQELKRLNRGNVKKSVDWLFDWLSDYNDAIENAVRLSAFKVAVESGLSEDKAASIAKNLTVNFNRKGARTGLISSLYAFFNAAIQGSARMVETLRGPMGKKIIYGGMFLGAMQAVILALSGFDDDEPPEFVKDKNLIIPIPFTDKKYLSVPMPLGFNMFPGFGRLAMEALLIETGMIRSRKGPGDKMMGAVSLVFDAFNPLGGAGNPLLMAVPTVGDPLAAIYSNRDAFGRPIYREDRGTAPTPGYERSRENASLFSKKLAEAINWATSPAGTQHTKGALSPTADQIDYFIGQITGGVGRELMKVGEFAKSKAVTQEEVPAYKLPIVGRFYGEAESPAATRSRFYENVKEMAKHEHEIKGLRKDRISPTEYIKANPEARLWQRANNVENQIVKLNKEKRALIEKDAPREAVKRKEDEILKKMTDFNNQVRRGQ